MLSEARLRQRTAERTAGPRVESQSRNDMDRALQIVIVHGVGAGVVADEDAESTLVVRIELGLLAVDSVGLSEGSIVEHLGDAVYAENARLDAGLRRSRQPREDVGMAMFGDRHPVHHGVRREM